MTSPTTPRTPFTPTTPVTVGTLHGWVLTVDGTEIRVEFDDADVGTYPVGRVRVGHLVDDEDEPGFAGSSLSSSRPAERIEGLRPSNE